MLIVNTLGGEARLLWLYYEVQYILNHYLKIRSIQCGVTEVQIPTEATYSTNKDLEVGWKSK